MVSQKGKVERNLLMFVHPPTFGNPNRYRHVLSVEILPTRLCCRPRSPTFFLPFFYCNDVVSIMFGQFEADQVATLLLEAALGNAGLSIFSGWTVDDAPIPNERADLSHVLQYS